MSIVPHRVRPFALALLLAVLSLASQLAPAAMERLGTQPGAVAASVPDTLLMVQWPPPSRPSRLLLTGRRVAALESTGFAPRPLVDGAQQPAVSPDGRELYFVQYQEVGDAVRVDLVALTTDSLALRWTTNVDWELARTGEPVGRTAVLLGSPTCVERRFQSFVTQSSACSGSARVFRWSELRQQPSLWRGVRLL